MPTVGRVDLTEVTFGRIRNTMKLAVLGLSEKQLDSEYRPGGWTIRQVVHHVPDSHLNAYVRFKLALTEDVLYVREDRVDDLGAVKLSSDIAEVISREMTFPGQIKVTVIREFRAIETAS